MSNAADLQRALQRLAGDPAGFTPLDPVPPVGGRAAARSRGLPGGGSEPDQDDLVEQDAASREYWEVRPLTSSDGLFVLEVEPIKLIVLEDGRRIELADPADES